MISSVVLDMWCWFGFAVLSGLGWSCWVGWVGLGLLGCVTAPTAR